MTTENANNDEFEPGLTHHIKHINPIIIPTTKDRFTGTVCCHANQLMYNAFDKTTRYCRLTFIPDITVPKTKISIEWIKSKTSTNENDDEWIQDIFYSEKYSGYLILNRARLCLYNPVTNVLNEFFTFNNRTMKRLACSEKSIYLISVDSSNANSDEIIIMNYNKEEKSIKTFSDIISRQTNRRSAPYFGKISDLSVGANEQVIIGYRFERRREVGICVFNVINDGEEWSRIRHLVLNDCWDENLPFTPRIDWCEALKVFILIEYMTGYLIMIDQEGQVTGECRVMHVKDQHESPINLSISTNDWLCVRYESSITIFKITL